VVLYVSGCWLFVGSLWLSTLKLLSGPYKDPHKVDIRNILKSGVFSYEDPDV